MRLAAGIEYDGTAYNGWQRVRSGIGVQAVVEKALARVADQAVEAVCAGRTDAGVHASGQVVHFESSRDREPRSWLLGANANLPDDVSLTWVRPVDEEFHARYSAVERSYRYLILNRLVRSALFRHRAWWVHQPLAESRMQQAGRMLIGEHDFSAFRAAGCQARSASRHLSRLEVERHSDWIVVTVTANAFLQHMVRNIVGLLAEIGRGDVPVEKTAEILESRDRTRAGVAAPARGLTLVSVTYPRRFELPVTAVSPLLPGMP